SHHDSSPRPWWLLRIRNGERRRRTPELSADAASARMRQRPVSGSVLSRPHALPRSCLCPAFSAAGRVALPLAVRTGRLPLAAGNARIHAIAMVRLRTPRPDPLAKRRRFIWLALARGLHEQGDLDAVVDVELVEEAGDVGLD